MLISREGKILFSPFLCNKSLQSNSSPLSFFPPMRKLFSYTTRWEREGEGEKGKARRDLLLLLTDRDHKRARRGKEEEAEV